MALTVIPAEASSWASDCVKPMMPNLEAQYAARRAPPFLPHWEDMLMMRPRTPRASIERATACEVMKVPLRLVSSTVSHDSSGRSTTSVRSRLPGAPALLTRMSMRPNSSSARDNLRHLRVRPDVRDLRDHPPSALADLVRDRFDTAPGARLQRGRHAQPGRDHVGQDEIGAL